MSSGFIYIWFDKKYKRYYVGAHWGTIEDGYICSSPWMLRSYKNRPHDFKRRIILRNISSRLEMFELEKTYLNMIKESEIKPNTDKPRYYNLRIGSNEVWHKYDEHIKEVGQKISEAKKGKSNPCSSEKARAISEAKKRKFAERGGMSEEHLAALREAASKRNYKHTEEWKQNNSERLKKQWQDGTRKPFGDMSEDHKDKISKSLSGIKREDVSNYKTSHSKRYVIYFDDGRELEVHGLKKFAEDHGIPYVTLTKAFQNQTSVKKYNINKLKEAV
jgi:hypothetical protein